MKNRTIFFNKKILIEATATIVGPKEGEGPLHLYFDNILKDDALGQKSYELAEIAMHTATISLLLNKTKHLAEDIDCFVAGDLLDEIVGSNFTMRNFDSGFLGVYNACSSFATALIVAALGIDSGHFERVVCSTSSHFSTAERQYRYPLELGCQRTPLSQWTTTGAGATMLNLSSGSVCLECATIGKVLDYGIKDANDMGACMAPAARETLLAHFLSTGRTPDYYDVIATGDLGLAGSNLLKELMKEKNIVLGDNYCDCGELIFNIAAQDVHQGGSGAGCSNVVFNGYFYNQLISGKIKNILLVPTGALLSKTSSLQGQSIPSIAHAISFVRV